MQLNFILEYKVGYTKKQKEKKDILIKGKKVSNCFVIQTILNNDIFWCFAINFFTQLSVVFIVDV